MKRTYSGCLSVQEPRIRITHSPINLDMHRLLYKQKNGASRFRAATMSIIIKVLLTTRLCLKKKFVAH